jgi:hypothetical protein
LWETERQVREVIEGRDGKNSVGRKEGRRERRKR